MKRLMILTLMFIPLFCYSEWTPWSPSGINANNINFGVYNNHDLVGTPTGFYIHDGPGGAWDFYSYGNLPVWGAAYVNNDYFLVVQGDGSFSDGIHYFNTQTHEFEFEMVEWLYKPTFVFYGLNSHVYFVGYEYGLVYSTNGLDWISVPNFDNTRCIDLVEYDDMMVLLTDEDQDNMYISYNVGETWEQPNNPLPFSDLDFSTYGKLYAIFPGLYELSGLYSSDDGYTWSNEFHLHGIGCLKTDVMGNVIVGWDEPEGGYEGLYMYDPASGSLKDINSNLPSHSINNITYSLWMSVIHLFVCTDDGVYFSMDYMVGINPHANNSSIINLHNYPDPFTDYTIIEYEITREPGHPVLIQIFDLTGNRVGLIENLPCMSGKHRIKYRPDGLKPGIYCYQLISGRNKISDKMILAR